MENMEEQMSRIQNRRGLGFNAHSNEFAPFGPEDEEIEQKKSCKQYGIMDKIISKWSHLSDKASIFWSFMLVLTGVYFSCETLQSSHLLKPSSYFPANTTSFAYNLLLIWLVNFFLLTQQKIADQMIPDNIFYWIFANIGGLGYAFLGDIPFTPDEQSGPNLWKIISIGTWSSIVTTSVIILILVIIELYKSYKYAKIKTDLLKILLVGAAYGYILSILIRGNALEIHYHAYHAIFAGVLSLWFSNWKNWVVILMHAILMGVVVEGIKFYGIGELFLFLTKGSLIMTFNLSITILICFYCVLGFLYSLTVC